MTGSTIAPIQKTQRFPFARTFHGCSVRRLDLILKKTPSYSRILVCKGPSNDGVVGVARGTVSQEIRSGAGFKTGIFVKKRSGAGGGVTAERLKGMHYSFFCEAGSPELGSSNPKPPQIGFSVNEKVQPDLANSMCLDIASEFLRNQWQPHPKN